MRLTNFSDYALRVLMYAATRSDRLITIEETAEVYGISRAHLMKVANQLSGRVFSRRPADGPAAWRWQDVLTRSG